MKRFIGLGLLLGLVTGGIGLYLIFSSPHMRVQPNVRAFQAIMPLPPPGSLPRGSGPDLLAVEEVRKLNPIPDTPQSRACGKVYYQYYCIFCHGLENGGRAPVGDSYMPMPPDLRQLPRAQYDDAKLLRAMLTGTGHDPVLARVVHPEHRWPLLLFVRSLMKEKR